MVLFSRAPTPPSPPDKLLPTSFPLPEPIFLTLESPSLRPKTRETTQEQNKNNNRNWNRNNSDGYDFKSLSGWIYNCKQIRNLI